MEHEMENNKKYTEVTFIKDGPIKVEGNFMIKGPDGNILSATNEVFLCRCGRSNNKPFCDDSHLHKSDDSGFVSAI